MPLRKYGSETLAFTASISIRNVPWTTYSVKSSPLTEGSFFIRKQSPVGGRVLDRVQTHMCTGVARGLAPSREHYLGQWKIQLLLQFAISRTPPYFVCSTQWRGPQQGSAIPPSRKKFPRIPYQCFSSNPQLVAFYLTEISKRTWFLAFSAIYSGVV